MPCLGMSWHGVRTEKAFISQNESPAGSPAMRWRPSQEEVMDRHAGTGRAAGARIPALSRSEWPPRVVFPWWR
jgi:hypothetical protein